MSGRHRLPDFLIVGAMKCGTTGLYRDLSLHPGVFMPRDKEPNALCADEVLGDTGTAQYASLFAAAGAGQVAGEASTAYTKLPTWPGVAARAHTLLGPDLKIIYIVRDPVARLVSHHYHDHARGIVPADIDVAVRHDSRLIDYGRYAMQLAPWLDTFGREQIHVAVFEDYTRNRQAGLERLLGFLGLDATGVTVDASDVHNRSDGKIAPVTGWRRRVRDSEFYRRLLRPMIPWRARQKLRRVVSPPVPPRPAPPSPATLSFVREQFEPDIRRLVELTGIDVGDWSRDRDRRDDAGGPQRTPAQ